MLQSYTMKGTRFANLNKGKQLSFELLFHTFKIQNAMILITVY